MKIIQVYKDVHPFVRGGIERYVHDLSVFLAASGHEVTVLAASDGLPDGGHVRMEGFTVDGYPCAGRLLSTPISPGLADVLRESEADVFHFHLPLPTAVMSWILSGRRTPYIVTYHSDIVRQAFLLPLYGPFLRRFLGRADRVLATSPAYAGSSRWLAGLSNVEIIPIGADPEIFNPGDEADTREHSDYFLFVGRFRSYKGIHVLLDAWKTMSDLPLLMAGGGPLRSQIIQTVFARKLNIRLVEDPSDEELVRLYRGAASLVLPSIHRSEAFGMVQVEAMACGTPVISTDLRTGVPWVNMDGVSGLVVPPGDPVALSDAVHSMTEPSLRKRLASGALERALTHFNAPELFSRVEAALSNAIENN